VVFTAGVGIVKTWNVGLVGIGRKSVASGFGCYVNDYGNFFGAHDK
jgi:hypothetical protein